jgi:regulator of protease activity HflC (stomatin/prohibitin superfamily)
MIRSSVLAGAAILSLLLPVACDKAADDQAKANNAQNEANAKIGAAQTEAAAKMNTAQADADRKIAEAQASFTKMREDFRHSTASDLVTLDKKIADLDAKSKTATGKAKADLDANLRTIHAQRDRFTADFNGLQAASASTWDAAKANLVKELSDLKALVDKS